MEVKLINEINPNFNTIEQILFNRGIAIEDMEDFLHTPDNVIHPFQDLDNITIARDCFLKHYQKKSKILIQVDCDTDGYTSAAELYNYLRANYPEVDLEYQVHDDKTHGLEITEDILNKRYDLIFIPDAGSEQFEEHKKLYDLGIDVIVLDHHNCSYESSNAIVVNNQLSKNYQNKDLSGVGVVWQFCRCLDEDYEFNQHHAPAELFLDLVSLGLNADMMDIKNLETKKLIEYGLRQIEEQNSWNNTFLNGLIHKQTYSMTGERVYHGQEITPMGILFYIAPLINAVTRVGTHEEREIVFKAFLEDAVEQEVPSIKRGHKPGDTETILEQAKRIVTNVKNRQKKHRDEAFIVFEKNITEDYLNTHSIIFIDAKGALDKNLNGLVANQIIGKYNRPALVMSKFTTEDGIVKYAGSARGVDGDICHDFRKFILNSGLAEYAQGHPNAFGVCFTEENLKTFLEYATEQLPYNKIEDTLNVDFVFEAADLNPQTVLDIGSLAPYWGNGFKEAIVAIKNIKITSQNKTLMSPDKNPTLKIMVGNIGFIKFKIDPAFFETLAPNNYTSTIVDIIGKCNINNWNGNSYPQILIDNFEVKGNITDF